MLQLGQTIPGKVYLPSLHQALIMFYSLPTEVLSTCIFQIVVIQFFHSCHNGQ